MRLDLLTLYQSWQFYRYHSLKLLNTMLDDVTLWQKIVNEFFSNYSKKVDDSDMEILVKKEMSCNPLWLIVACEELRIFGDFRQLAQKFRCLADTLDG